MAEARSEPEVEVPMNYLGQLEEVGWTTVGKRGSSSRQGTGTNRSLSSIEGVRTECVRFIADSGATETIIPRDVCQGVPLVMGEKAKAGVQYKVANGHRIDNLGEKKLSCKMVSGMRGSIIAQVGDVQKPLYSISQCVRAGHRVVFDEGQWGSYIENKKTGKRAHIEDCQCTYVLPVEVSFHRQG